MQQNAKRRQQCESLQQGLTLLKTQAKWFTDALDEGARTGDLGPAKIFREAVEETRKRLWAELDRAHGTFHVTLWSGSQWHRWPALNPRISFVDSRFNEYPFREQRENRSVDIRLIAFNEFVTTDQVLKRLHIWGLRPASAEEFVAFATAHLDELKDEAEVVALDGRFPNLGQRQYPVLQRRGNATNFVFTSTIRWSGETLFATVRASS